MKIFQCNDIFWRSLSSFCIADSSFTECILFVKQDSISLLESPCYYPIIAVDQTVEFEYYKPMNSFDGWYIEVYRHDFITYCGEPINVTLLQNLTLAYLEFRENVIDVQVDDPPRPFTVRI